jgi:hypothetical protein
MRFLQDRADVRLVPPATLRLELDPPLLAPKPGPARPAPPTRAARGLASRNAASWWTVRATAGEVTGGFSKDEILKPVHEDPRASGGLFERVGGLLAELTALR